MLSPENILSFDLSSLKLPTDDLGRKACCAALYELEPVRLLLGDTLHPGGLSLTHRLGKLTGIQHDDRVLDVACGRGASALAVARSFHCRVVGVDIGTGGLLEAARQASETGVENRAGFVRADGESLAFGDGTFDAVLSECSMSLFPDRTSAVSEMARVLRPGGRLGISDVTVEPGALPETLTGTLGQMLCLASAPPLEGYLDLLDTGPLTVVHRQDASEAVLRLLDDIGAKLAVFRGLLSMGGSGDSGPTAQARPVDMPGFLSQALDLLEEVRALVEAKRVGYWLMVAEKGR